VTIFRKLFLTLVAGMLAFGLGVFALLARQREIDLHEAEIQTATREMTRLLAILIY